MPNIGLGAQCWDEPGCLSPLNDEQANKFTLFRGQLGDSVLGKKKVSPATLTDVLLYTRLCPSHSWTSPLLTLTQAVRWVPCPCCPWENWGPEKPSPLTKDTNLISSWTYDSNRRLSDARAQGRLAALPLKSVLRQNNLSKYWRQSYNFLTQNLYWWMDWWMDWITHSFIQ